MAFDEAEGAENLGSVFWAGMQVAGHSITDSLPRREGDGASTEHPSSDDISPFKRTGYVILEDSGWKALPSIWGAQRNPCAIGRVSLDLVSHIPAHHQSTGTSCFLGTEISNKKTYDA